MIKFIIEINNKTGTTMGKVGETLVVTIMNSGPAVPMDPFVEE